MMCMMCMAYARIANTTRIFPRAYVSRARAYPLHIMHIMHKPVFMRVSENQVMHIVMHIMHIVWKGF